MAGEARRRNAPCRTFKIGIGPSRNRWEAAMRAGVWRSAGGAVMAGAMLLAAAAPAQARSFVGFGFNLGVPVFGAPPPVYYPPPPIYYAPPPVYYYPSPVIVAPPPPAAATQTSPATVSPSGGPCHEFRSTALIEGVNRPVYGTVCQQPDGSWRIVR